MKGLWVKLSVDYLDDPKILKVGRDGEVLFIRSLAYAKKQNDGFVPEPVLTRIGFGFGPLELAEIATALVREGLWQVVEGGWQITAWSLWQVDTSSERAGFANHKRWHKTPKEGCEWCASKWTPNGLQMDVQMDSRVRVREESLVDNAPAVALCERLKALMVENGCKPPTVTSRWVGDMAKLIRLDGHTQDEITAVIEWSQADPFWRSNILSPGKLRAKYDTLRLRMGSQPATEPPATQVCPIEAMAIVDRKVGARVEDDWIQSKMRSMTAEDEAKYRAVLEHGLAS